MAEKFPIVARTLTGLEEALGDELRGLGAESIEVGKRFVAFTGDRTVLYRANLCCRLAIRILTPIAEFPATDEKQLYAGVQAIDWADLVASTGSIWVDPHVRDSFLTHSLYGAQLVKDAIVDQLRERFGKRPTVDRDRPDLRIALHLSENRARLYRDASGESLHKRGYRAKTLAAPLSEVLAAGMLVLAGWSSETPLVDGMCGAGTIAIEAALLARNLAPGLHRPDFGFFRWRDFDRDLWASVVAEARKRARPTAEITIRASDQDCEAVSIARDNARRAGVAADIRFEESEFERLRPEGPAGLVVLNPPYDERLKAQRLGDLYRRIGDVLKQRFGGWQAAILTGSREAAKNIGLRPRRRFVVFNGPIECRLLAFDLVAPRPRAADAASDAIEQPGGDDDGVDSVPSSPSSSPARVGGRSEAWARQAEIFRNRLEKLARHRRKWARRQDISCYRLYERDIPEIPFVIDWYEGRLHAQEFERPHDRTEGEHSVWVERMIRLAGETLGVDRADIFVKRHIRRVDRVQYDRVDDIGRVFDVREGGLTFKVNLSDYLDTGLFLDHRQTRAMVRAAAKGKRFLNLFAYTGSFTVYAAAGEATETTTVDLSNTYLEWAEANLAANDFKGKKHRLVRDDGREFLRRDRGAPYDLVVIDPPTFSNSKRTKDDWDVQRDHRELLELAISRTSPRGLIYFSTNSRRFRFDAEDLPGWTSREITRQTLPPDFRNRRIHRSFLIMPAAVPSDVGQAAPRKS